MEEEQSGRLEESQDGLSPRRLTEEGVTNCQKSVRKCHLKQCFEKFSCYWERRGSNDPPLKLIQPEKHLSYLLYM